MGGRPDDPDDPSSDLAPPLPSMARSDRYTRPYPVASGRTCDPPIARPFPVSTASPCRLVSLLY